MTIMVEIRTVIRLAEGWPHIMHLYIIVVSGTRSLYRNFTNSKQFEIS